MGAVGAWIKVIVGFFVLAASFIFSQPMFDMLFAIGSAMGGNAAEVTELCRNSLNVLPKFIAGSLILWGILEATRKEDNSGWR